MSSAPAAPPVDREQVADWFTLLYGGARGHLNIVSTRGWAGVTYPLDAGLEHPLTHVEDLHRRGAAGIYSRVSTLAEPPPRTNGHRGRGKVALTASLPALWLDLDIEGPGHQHTVCAGGQACTHLAEGTGHRLHRAPVLPLPPDEPAARAIVEVTGLPGPSVWVHSGGGLYPLWLLRPAHEVSDDLAEVAGISAGWQDAHVAAARELGYHYGAGIGDLARVLRIPGTWNRKPDRDEPALCRVLQDTGERYVLGELADALARIRRSAPAPALPLPARRPDSQRPAGDVKPGVDFTAAVDWADPLLLGGLGWTLTYTHADGERGWLRPGAHSDLTATTGRGGYDNLWVFSTETPFPAGEVISKFRAFRIIHGYGSDREAALALNRLGYGSAAVPAAPVSLGGLPAGLTWPQNATLARPVAPSPNGAQRPAQAPVRDPEYDEPGERDDPDFSAGEIEPDLPPDEPPEDAGQPDGRTDSADPVGGTIRVLADLDAERAVLAACLRADAEIVGTVRKLLPPAAFYNARHVEIWKTVTDLHDAGTPADLITVAARLPEHRGYLHALTGRPVVDPAVTRAHAGVVATMALRRGMAETGARLGQLAQRPEDTYALLAKAHDNLGALMTPVAEGREAAAELDAFLAEPTPEYDWLIPELLERGDRVILTGNEGKGKSTLLRQIGIQAAAGIHPFTFEPIDPVGVLYVDLENPGSVLRRKLRGIRAGAGQRYQNTPGLHVRTVPQGLDLLDTNDARYLTELVVQTKPGLLIIGPIYKLASGDPTEEAVARTVALWLDRLRADHGLTLLIEAHTPYGAAGGKRPERPYGASLWSRWPEFGIYLSEEGHLRHWRGARDERAWPSALRRGGEWPWSPVDNPGELRWIEINRLCLESGGQLAERELAKLMGVSQSTVHRCIDRHRAEWDALAAPPVNFYGQEEGN